MVHVEKGIVSIEGTTGGILADISTMVCAIAENGLKGFDTKEEVKEAVLRAVELGFKSEEELEQEYKKKVNALKSDLSEAIEAALDKLFSTEGGEE